MKVTAVILAAGFGTRMKSSLPKVLHLLAGRPLVLHVLSTAATATTETPVIVVGHEGEAVQKVVGSAARYAFQEEQLGTAHALKAAETLLAEEEGLILVVSADMPLFLPETLKGLIDSQKSNPGPMTISTVIREDPHGFGRIIRDEHGSVVKIVEEAQATPEQLMVKEHNVAAYCFDGNWLWGALDKVTLSPKGEYYLTDLVEIAASEGLQINAVSIEEEEEAVGINNRVHLAEAEAVMHKRINEKWMLSGVTMIDPHSVYIETDVSIGKDTVIWPNTYLHGKTKIGAGCKIGPNSIVTDTIIGDHCKVLSSVLDGAVLEDHVDIGPFGRLRKGAHLAQGVHMGNFGEVKDSYLGPGTKMGHFSYIGNATIGPDVNIGAGTITCNYDGVKKHPTEIGAGAFIGSDTMLVAPVRVGEGAHTGAGAVVTHDVPPGEVVVGVPARPLRELKEKKRE